MVPLLGQESVGRSQALSKPWRSIVSVRSCLHYALSVWRLIQYDRGDTETCLAILRGYSRGGWLERDELSSPYASPSSLPDGRHFERVSGPPQDYGPGTNVDRIIAARDRRIAASEAVESALRRDGRAEPTVGPLFGVLSSEHSSEESRL